ncbi:NAD(P)H-dependent oxidoreductase [Streptacidiphilus sp. PB12-B1b]|uniref:NADPH-dependent FMN reductase n=1 Tax=Streptacidiphilus sp. PB12-B1b TaxID=2705012 RepID=UPI0015FDADF8|nr:NAD(P)H-dependent oxidoreductase [Streptacidiphilus sp. PB12-B1b]QMU76677.1 NAD(P)H-dependent oxidoreductase [Streptacidiphilus sp. PB12-B1b]
MSVVVLVGNPRPQSRTREAAELVAGRLTDRQPDRTVELADLGPALFDPQDPRVAEAAAEVQGASLLVVASPTYKASYTGLLKLFLDGLGSGSLAGVTAVPLLLGAHWRHSLAAELQLKPVLVELGATVPTRGLFLLDADYTASEELEKWLTAARPQVAASLGAEPVRVVS